MARMIPPSPVADAPDSEVKTYHVLSALSSYWTVIHSVHWQSIRHGREADGEADFVLIHPRHGVVVLEVKGGGVVAEAGVWKTRNRHGVVSTIKNPFEQAVASKHALIRYLRNSVPGGDRIPVCHAVVFPDIEVAESLGLDAPSAITLDSRRLREIDRAISGVTGHWRSECNVSPATVDAIVARLRPTVEIRRLLRDDLRSVHEELVALTAQQIGVLSGLRRNRRARILGGAGTGKTILAIEKAREFASQGLRTLITCFNEPLSSMTARVLDGQPNLVARNFHSFCLSLMRDAGMRPPSAISDDWWNQESPEALVVALEKTEQRFDAIVVDEGQDFSSDWITALMMALADPDRNPFYVFLDSHQDIYVRGCAYPSDWPCYELSTNCRNTFQIAARVASVFGDAVNTLGVRGPEVVIEHVSEREMVGRLEARVERLIEREKVGPEQITVLCTSRQLVEQLRTMSLGNHVFCAPGRKGIAVETVWRFKGLETPVAVLCMSNLAPDAKELARAVAYVGLSRPHSALFVLATSEWREILAGSSDSAGADNQIGKSR